MKKLIAFVLVLILAFYLTGCGKPAPVVEPTVTELAVTEPVSEPAPVAEETEISGDVAEVTKVDAELEDTEVEEALGDVDSVLGDW